MSVQKYYDAAIANQRLAEKKTEIEQQAEQGKKSLTAGLTELVALQTAEIERLQGILKDATTFPERRFTAVSVSTSIVNDSPRFTFVALASDSSAWMMSNLDKRFGISPKDWERLPNLPQAADEAGVA